MVAAVEGDLECEKWYLWIYFWADIAGAHDNYEIDQNIVQPLLTWAFPFVFHVIDFYAYDKW